MVEEEDGTEEALEETFSKAIDSVLEKSSSGLKKSVANGVITGRLVLSWASEGSSSSRKGSMASLTSLIRKE